MNDWVSRQLGDLYNFQNGRSFKRSEWSDSGLPIIRIQNLNKADAGFNYFLGEFDNRIFINDGDLLFSWSGTVGSSFGPHFWWRGEGLLNQHIFKVTRKNEWTTDRFSYWLLKFITSTLEKNVNGAVGLQHVTKSFMNLFEVSIPPIQEQNRIVEILDEAFAAIDQAKSNIERNIANARELFQSRLDALVNQESRTWSYNILENILVLQPRNGWSPPAKHHSTSGVPVLTLSSVTRFIFKPEKIKHTSAETDPDRHYWVENGDLLITRSNTEDLVGHVAIAKGIDRPTIYPDLIMKMRPNPDIIYTPFLYYLLRSPTYRSIISSRAKGANPTMKKLTKSAVQSLPIHYPDLTTQKNISVELDNLSFNCACLEIQYVKKLQNLHSLRQSILDQAFKGKLTS